MNQKIYTLKSKRYGLMLSWTVVRPVEALLPTHDDFKAKYGDEYYAPFHEKEEIVELVEKI